MIWYKFDIGEYLAQTRHLSDAEDLAYRRLIDFYYLLEKPLPLDTQSVARHIGFDLDITESVLAEFFDQNEEGYCDNRLDADIAKRKRLSENNRRHGKLGGRPKKS
jgi:uncharacterized protein YdaU (DUF1376 family)